MKIVIFGLSISSTWGNGHATLWRGLCRALSAAGHSITFYERDVPYYASHRDFTRAPWCRLVLYETWDTVAVAARHDVADADVGIVTSYCPDAREASSVLLDSPAMAVFYDLDSPVTLERLHRGETVPYLPANGLADFELTLSYAGGAALDGLRTQLGAQAVAPLYGSVDPDVHHPVRPSAQHQSDLSYLGTYASDRQPALDQFFLEPARRCPRQRFALAGSQYPDDVAWSDNVVYFSHVAPAEHPSFFCSSRFTLNITRAAMVAIGHCPSGRLFEAAACGAAVLSDWWEGLDEFLAPGRELIAVRTSDDVLAALTMGDEERRRIGEAARERVLASHTAAARARELEQLFEPRWRARAGVA